jgi:hypothetical protein
MRMSGGYPLMIRKNRRRFEATVDVGSSAADFRVGFSSSAGS